MTKEAPKAKAAEAAPAAFPYSGSINEPQTVTLPLPEGTEVPKPSISSINPIDAAIGDEDFTLYVSGENFFHDSVINFAGQDEPTTLNEDGTLSTGVNMAMWQGPDTVPVVVKNGPEVSAPVDFTFHEAGAKRSKSKK
jgi:hypothetical protein